MVVLAVSACAQKPVAAVASASPSRSPSASGSPVGPNVQCVARPTGAPMVLLDYGLYDVGDPVHPRLLCHMHGWRAHLFTGDTFEYLRSDGNSEQAVLHSIGSGNESVIATWPAPMGKPSAPFDGAWTLDGGAAATALPITDTSGRQWYMVWLYTGGSPHLVFRFHVPRIGCDCRFGEPTPTLAFSPDGQYLVAGWPAGTEAAGLEIFRVSDQQLVETFASNLDRAFWAPSGHQLFVTGRQARPQSWTPEAGVATVAAAGEWQFWAGAAPDGSAIAYTAYADPTTTAKMRVYVFDIATQKTRMLLDAPRSEVTFVKDGWVWYREEVTCGSCHGGTQASDKVFAMNLATGSETPVVFASGESPATVLPSWGSGEFWPNS